MIGVSEAKIMKCIWRKWRNIENNHQHGENENNGISMAAALAINISAGMKMAAK